MRVHAMVNTRCEGTDRYGGSVSRSVGTPRKQFPRHAEIVRSSPRVAWDRGRGTCLGRFPRAACGRPLLSAFVFSTAATLWIDTGRIRELYATVHVWGLHCLRKSFFLHTGLPWHEFNSFSAVFHVTSPLPFFLIGNKLIIKKYINKLICVYLYIFMHIFITYIPQSRN